jgi:hypothetical protein
MVLTQNRLTTLNVQFLEAIIQCVYNCFVLKNVIFQQIAYKKRVFQNV